MKLPSAVLERWPPGTGSRSKGASPGPNKSLRSHGWPSGRPSGLSARPNARKTRIKNVRAQGAAAYHNGVAITGCPYKHGVTFGVNQGYEWRQGWLQAKELDTNA